jgi:hypothetical protein
MPEYRGQLLIHQRAPAVSPALFEVRLELWRPE